MSKYPKTLGRIEAVWNKLGAEEGVDRFLNNEFDFADPAKSKKGAKAPEPLFTFVGTFKSEGTKEFVAAKKYVIDTSEKSRVRISYLGDNFKKFLLPKVERDIATADLILSKLRRRSIDLPKSPEEPGTIAGLGGLVKAETSLYEFHETLAYKQASGDLSWLVGYVRDDNNVLWPVDAYWHDYGWGVEADSVSCQYEWHDGCEFLSR